MSVFAESYHTACEHLPLESEGGADTHSAAHPSDDSDDRERSVVGTTSSPCSSVSATCSKSSIAVYTPINQAKRAEDCRNKARWIEQHLIGDRSRATRSHRLHMLKQAEPRTFSTDVWCAYLYEHPEDCPEDLEQTRRQEERARALEEYGEDSNGELFHIETRQLEIFGPWSWPTGEAKADWEVAVGPKDEEIYLHAIIPDLSKLPEVTDGPVKTPTSRRSERSLQESMSDIKDSVTGLYRKLSRLGSWKAGRSPKSSKTS